MTDLAPLNTIFRASLVSQIKNLPATQIPGFDTGVGKISWDRKWPGEFVYIVYLPGEFMDKKPGRLQSRGATKSQT